MQSAKSDAETSSAMWFTAKESSLSPFLNCLPNLVQLSVERLRKRLHYLCIRKEKKREETRI